MTLKVSGSVQRGAGIRAMRMGAARLYIVALLLVICCREASGGQENPSPSADSSISGSSQGSQEKQKDSTEVDKQLNIYKTTLLDGKTEQIRIDAATMMLFSENPLARQVLLDVLRQPDNHAARAAICKALSQTRAEHKLIKSSEDFIKPLIELLVKEEDFSRARLVAEATLIFKYGQVREPLEKVVSDVSLPARARLNAIYTLQLHPDLQIVFKLLALTEDPDAQVVSSAEKALRTLGIQISRDVKAREAILNALQQLGSEEFLRDRLIRQETDIRIFETQVSLWQGRYLALLNDLYDSKSDDAARSQFLALQLGGNETIVKLWALDKLAEMRKGTDRPKISGQLESILLNLISDENKDIRLKTAVLLSLMWEVNAAERLLAQLKIEQDDQVRTRLFIALGGTCYFASLPNTGLKIPGEIRKETLEWAVIYLSAEDTDKARAGADVIRKLLEQDGLSAEQVSRYLGAIAARYSRQKAKADRSLCGELLSAMAGLCAQRSMCKDQAATLFKSVFEESLGDETDLIRQAAVDGLVNIDKAAALRKLRTSLINDPNPAIKKRLVELAGEAGGKEDIGWLTEKVNSGNESELAWQAMLKIFGRASASDVYEWTSDLDAQFAKGKLSDEQAVAFLQMAEQKAVSENKVEIRDNIRLRLARLYTQKGQFQQSAEYLGLLRDSAANNSQKQSILSELLQVYLRWPKVDLAAKLIENALQEADLGPDNALLRTLDGYFTKPAPGTDPDAVLKALIGIVLKATEDRPGWRQQLKRWSEAFAKASSPEKADATSN